MITDRQLELRNKGLGSSDIASIMGLNPYQSPRDVWLLKTGRVATLQDAGQAAHLGSMIEPAILALAAEELGDRVVAPTSTFTRGILRANIDGMVGVFKRGSPIVEAKMTSISDGWGEPHSSIVPDRVMLQVQMQMLCAESQIAHVARLLVKFGASFDLFHVPFDPQEAEKIEEIADAWWGRHVVYDEEPSGTVNQDLLVRRIRVSGARVSMHRSLVVAERQAHAAAKAAEAVHDLAKSDLISALGEAEFGDVEGGGTVSYKTVTTNRLDTKALTEAHPDLVSGFKRESTSRRLTVTGLESSKNGNTDTEAGV